MPKTKDIILSAIIVAAGTITIAIILTLGIIAKQGNITTATAIIGDAIALLAFYALYRFAEKQIKEEAKTNVQKL